MGVVDSMLCRNDLETGPTRLFGAAQDAGLPRTSSLPEVLAAATMYPHRAMSEGRRQPKRRLFFLVSKGRVNFLVEWG